MVSSDVSSHLFIQPSVRLPEAQVMLTHRLGAGRREGWGQVVPDPLVTSCHPPLCLLSSPGGGRPSHHVPVGTSEAGRTRRHLQPGPGGSLRVHLL